MDAEKLIVCYIGKKIHSMIGACVRVLLKEEFKADKLVQMKSNKSWNIELNDHSNKWIFLNK